MFGKVMMVEAKSSMMTSTMVLAAPFRCGVMVVRRHCVKPEGWWCVMMCGAVASGSGGGVAGMRLQHYLFLSLLLSTNDIFE